MEKINLPSLFRLACNVSNHSDCYPRMGAVIVKCGHPISVGFNKNKTHPIYKNSNRTTIHAEVSAIISSGKEIIPSSEVFVYRQTADGRPANAKPCEDCLERLKDFGVNKIYYTTSNFPYWKVERI